MKINGFTLEFSKEAEKDYMKLSNKNQNNVINKLKKVYTTGSIQDAAPLKEYRLLKRVKVGNYRIVIHFVSKTLHEIVMIKDRKEVYDLIKRKEVNYG